MRASFARPASAVTAAGPFLDIYIDWQSPSRHCSGGRGERGAAAGVDLRDAATLVLTVSAGLEMVWWANIRHGSMIDSLAASWALVLPGIATPVLAVGATGGLPW